MAVVAAGGRLIVLMVMNEAKNRKLAQPTVKTTASGLQSHTTVPSQVDHKLTHTGEINEAEDRLTAKCVSRLIRSLASLVDQF